MNNYLDNVELISEILTFEFVSHIFVLWISEFGLKFSAELESQSIITKHYFVYQNISVSNIIKYFILII